MAQIQTLSKALDILNALGKADHLLSVEEIAGELELPESTVYRMLQTLEAKDFIQRYSRKKIGLGSNFISLSRNLYDRMDQELILIATPYMEQVSALTKETSILSVRAGLDSICIKSVSSKYIIRFVAEDNRLLKLNLGASSKAILAYENKRIIRMILDTLETQEEKDALEEELSQIRKQGYSITDNQYDVSSVGIAVPIFNTFGKIYASLAMVGPDSRIRSQDRNFCICTLKKAAKEITDKLAEKN